MKRPGALAVAACALLGAAALWWLSTDTPPGRAGTPGTGMAGSAPGATAPGADRMAGGPAGLLAPPPRAGTTDAGSSDPLLAPGLRDTLEALLHAAGDAPDPETLKQRLEGLVGQHFPASLSTRALALARRYVDYRVALGRLKAPADPTDPRGLREAMAERQKVRLQYFDGDEYDTLFAREAELDQYMLARLEITRNDTLTPAQKRTALQDAEASLDAERRAQRTQAVAHVGVAEQTAAFNAQGVDERTRHAQRSAQYGEEAAQRLAQLDRQESDWQSRLNQYQQARHASTDPARLQQLRDQLFSPQEQLRIDAALALRAQPATTTR